MDSHTSILSCTILPIRSQNIPVGSSTPWRTPALHSCHSHLCGSSACHAVPCFGRSLLKPISCFMLKKQCSKEVSTGGCSIYGCSFSICLTLNLLTQSCFPLSPPPIFLLHTCFQSVPSAPPVILSSLLLLPQTH